jgi:hypothetical protein
MRKGKDPARDPYLCLMDPDPGGPKTCGSGSKTAVNEYTKILGSRIQICSDLGLLAVTGIFRAKAGSRSFLFRTQIYRHKTCFKIASVDFRSNFVKPAEGTVLTLGTY